MRRWNKRVDRDRLPERKLEEKGEGLLLLRCIEVEADIVLIL